MIKNIILDIGDVLVKSNWHNLKADECIFIDDLETNVNNAKKLGMHGIVFQNQPQAENEIKAIRRSFE